MKVAAMRAVDRTLGRPICGALTLLRRLRGDRGAGGPVRRVLFVKLSEMGALVLSAPAFDEARRLYPDAEVWLLCFEENAEIASVAAGFPRDRLIVVRAGGIAGTIAGLLGAVSRVRALEFDVVIDLEYLSRVSAILSYLTGAAVRAGYHRFEAEGLYCGDLYTHRNTWNAYLHVAQSYVALVRSTTSDPATAPLPKDPAPALADLRIPVFEPTAADLAAVRSILAARGVADGADLVLVNPNSSDLLPLRRWPEDRFAALCTAIAARHPGVQVVLTGAAHEAALEDRISAAVGSRDGSARCVSLVGATDLRQLLTLFTMARVLVSADSGPPHFAALTRLRCVTLFGPETPALYGPVTPRNEAIWAGLACSPCIHAWNRRVSACTDNQCMAAIGVAQVAAAVDRALAAAE